MEQNNVIYTKGFNNGYLLAKHEPDLLASLLKQITPSTEYLEGLFSGKEEYEIEYSRMQMDELNRLRSESKDQDHDLGLHQS